MKTLLTVLFSIVLATGLTQQSIEGIWQGIIYPEGQAMIEGSVIWLSLSENGNKISGISRNEIYDTPYYAIKKLKGTINKKSNESERKLILEEFVVSKKKATSSHTWCKLNFELTYNDKTGYLEGTYSSSDCRRVVGKIKLYRSEYQISESDTMTLTHAWAKKLIDDLLKGKNAPQIRQLEREDFVFTPIYFDYDKSFIRKEYEAYLKRMAAIVLDHSDLRIQVTGHTDGDGSDEYNMALSERRAKEIVTFFVNEGLKEDRIVIDFKGKRSPIAPNETKEGMQLNRRVDFKFI
jgi:OmpA-OmpF porin, OOP family